VNFRQSTPGEAPLIAELFTRVFRESEGPSEGHLIGNLAINLLNWTDSEDLFVFVAVEENSLIGAIIVTRMPNEKEKEIFVLAPVAVDTKHQGRGIGQNLIKFGIGELKEKGVRILMTYGDPNFYCKVGFQQISEELITPPFKLTMPEGWLAYSLDGNPLHKIEGKCSCVSALNNSVYW
jgi:putative acetyltransferase